MYTLHLSTCKYVTIIVFVLKGIITVTVISMIQYNIDIAGNNMLSPHDNCYYTIVNLVMDDKVHVKVNIQ